MKQDIVYLKHVLDAIGAIQEYARGVDEVKFVYGEERRTSDAVIRQIEVIGMAVKNLSPALRAAHPRVPWKDIAGMRDKVSHDYMGVDLFQVWEVAKKDLPALKKQVRKITLAEEKIID